MLRYSLADPKELAIKWKVIETTGNKLILKDLYQHDAQVFPDHNYSTSAHWI